MLDDFLFEHYVSVFCCCFWFVHLLHFGSLWSLATENLHISILGDVWSHNDKQIYVPECVRYTFFSSLLFQNYKKIKISLKKNNLESRGREHK